MKCYSQNDEQDVILEFFQGRTGKFLDIGAYNGVDLSNTRALVELGWSGIMVEPNPYNLVPLIESIKPFADRVEVWAAAVSPSPRPSILRLDEAEGRGFASTICGSNPHVIQPSPVKLIIPTVLPKDLLWHGPFQFISIDAEWMDFEILLDFPHDLMGCELLCIEPSGLLEREKMKRCLVDEFQFTVLHETPENIMACKRA